MAENKSQSMTPVEAIYDVRERMVRVETLMVGVPGTSDRGLAGKVVDNCDNLDATRKKVGRLELKFWLLVGLLGGSGILGGVGLANLMS